MVHAAAPLGACLYLDLGMNEDRNARWGKTSLLHSPGFPWSFWKHQSLLPSNGFRGEGCHTVREEMAECIPWNNNPGPKSCIWDFQDHERSSTLEMKGSHALASKIKVKAPLSHTPFKCTSTLPLPFDVWSGQVPSFFKYSLFLSCFEKSWAHQLLVSCRLHFAVFSRFPQHSLYNKVTFLCLGTCPKTQSSAPGQSSGASSFQLLRRLWIFLNLNGLAWSFKNFSSVDVENAHKQCSPDTPYTCIYLGAEKI